MAQKDKFREQVKRAQSKRKMATVKKESKRLMEGMGYQIGGTTKGSKLNFADSPYNKKIKQKEKEMVDDIFNEDRYEYVETPISDKMTVKEIRNYIKQAVADINKTVDELDVDERVKQSFDYIGGRYGMYRGKLTTLSGARKEDLLAYARNLKAHIAIDEWTSYGKDRMTEKAKKAFVTYMMHNPNIHLTMQEFNNVTKMFAAMSQSLIEKYDSTELIDLWQKQQGKEMIVTPQSFAEIALEVYEKNKNRGLTKSQLGKAFYKELKHTFDSTYKKKARKRTSKKRR